MKDIKGSIPVRQLLIRVSDQLSAGEIKLIEVTLGESVAAKKRLESHRHKTPGEIRKEVTQCSREKICIKLRSLFHKKFLTLSDTLS